MQQDKIWDYFQNEGMADRPFPEARQRFVLRHLRAGQRVLDVGVGGGILERLAMAKGVDIYALDPNARAIERLREELQLGEKAQSGYAQHIPFPDASFDIVVMSEVLEHLDDKALEESLDDVRRVLKPGGTLLATTPYKENLGINTVVCPDCAKVFHKVGHVQSFDRTRISKVLIERGYEISHIHVTTFVNWRRNGLRNFLKSAIRVLLARIGEGIADPHIVVRARRH